MAPSHSSRSASLTLALFGISLNITSAMQVLTACKSLRWEQESEWETSMGIWRIDGLKLALGLLLAYFVSAAVMCVVGCMGVYRNKLTFVRMYRNYSIIDFSFCALFTTLASYAALKAPVRASVCKEFSHHPGLMRDMVEMGLNLQNCERYLEAAVFGIVGFIAILMTIRLHFLLTLTKYYTSLDRHHRNMDSLPSYRDEPVRSLDGSADSMRHHHQRVWVLPGSHPSVSMCEKEVYAPIQLDSLPTELADKLEVTATEVWMLPAEPRLHLHDDPPRYFSPLQSKQELTTSASPPKRSAGEGLSASISCGDTLMEV